MSERCDIQRRYAQHGGNTPNNLALHVDALPCVRALKSRPARLFSSGEGSAIFLPWPMAIYSVAA
jgi:hypothetical protein